MWVRIQPGYALPVHRQLTGHAPVSWGPPPLSLFHSLSFPHISVCCKKYTSTLPILRGQHPFFISQKTLFVSNDNSLFLEDNTYSPSLRRHSGFNNTSPPPLWTTHTMPLRQDTTLKFLIHADPSQVTTSCRHALSICCFKQSTFTHGRLR